MISEPYHTSGSRGSKVTPELRTRDPFAGQGSSVELLRILGFSAFSMDSKSPSSQQRTKPSA